MIYIYIITLFPFCFSSVFSHPTFSVFMLFVSVIEQSIVSKTDVWRETTVVKTNLWYLGKSDGISVPRDFNEIWRRYQKATRGLTSENTNTLSDIKRTKQRIWNHENYREKIEQEWRGVNGKNRMNIQKYSKKRWWSNGSDSWLPNSEYIDRRSEDRIQNKKDSKLGKGEVEKEDKNWFERKRNAVIIILSQQRRLWRKRKRDKHRKSVQCSMNFDKIRNISFYHF